MATATQVSETTEACAKGMVLFVHGIDGNFNSTWSFDGKPENFWPTWLASDFPDLCVSSIGYDASSTGWRGFSMSLIERATNLIHYLATRCTGDCPIVFICHSLGGLVVKQMLRTAYDSNRNEYLGLATRLRGIMFLSTPHSGSDLASAERYVRWIYRSTQLLQNLQSNSDFLINLNHWFRDNIDKLAISVETLAESRDTFGVRVVADTDPGIRNRRPIPVDADHISICKPASRDSEIYTSACAFVRNCVNVKVESPPLVKIVIKVDGDPRSLTNDMFCELLEAAIQMAQIGPPVKVSGPRSGCVEFEMSLQPKDADKLLSAVRLGLLDSLGIIEARVVEDANTEARREVRMAIPMKRIPPRFAIYDPPTLRYTLVCHLAYIDGFDQLGRDTARVLPPETASLESCVVFVRRQEVMFKSGGATWCYYAQCNLIPNGYKYTTKLLTNETTDLHELAFNLVQNADTARRASSGRLSLEDARVIADNIDSSVRFLLHDSLFNSDGTCQLHVGPHLRWTVLHWEPEVSFGRYPL